MPIEEAGVRTWSTQEMAVELLALCTADARALAAGGPNQVDLTGGLAQAKLDLPALAKQAMEAAANTPDAEQAEVDVTIAALPAPPTLLHELARPEWADVDVDPADLVVIVGAGEVGPVGSARTRFEMEVDEENCRQPASWNWPG